MIEYIKGEIAELSPATAVIDCNGLGYAVNISLNTYSAIQGKSSCKLYIYEAIREDAYVLYGFADKQEREYPDKCDKDASQDVHERRKCIDYCISDGCPIRTSVTWGERAYFI